MGCGSSSSGARDAAAASKVKSRDGEKESELAIGQASQFIAQSGDAAIKSAAAGAKGSQGDAWGDPSNSQMLYVAADDGLNLLNACEHLPWVGPIAFLMSVLAHACKKA